MSIELGEMRSGPLSPLLALSGEEVILQIGTPGAFGIPQTTMQMTSNVLDLQMNVQAASRRPGFGYMVERKLASNVESEMLSSTRLNLAGTMCKF